jgi:hypothetical protein
VMIGGRRWPTTRSGPVRGMSPLPRDPQGRRGIQGGWRGTALLRSRSATIGGEALRHTPRPRNGGRASTPADTRPRTR